MYEITAPPKINLYLHITGKRHDGYHLLDSLVVFPKDIGDVIRVESAGEFTLSVSGPFAHHAGPDEGNLALRAYHALPPEMRVPVTISLEKNIPAGAGLGGGSGDAAAVVRAMEVLSGQQIPSGQREQLLLSLGADVPVCYRATPTRMQGIGDLLAPAPAMPQAHILLCWPGAPSYTKDVFRAWNQNFLPPLTAIPRLESIDALIEFLKLTDNALSAPAQATCPVIGDALGLIAAQDGCLLSRMTGSGSCVFGLFGDDEAADAAANIAAHNPGWWVRAGRL